MKEERFFYDPTITLGTQGDAERVLPQEEAVHAIRVLRLKEGDQIFLIDGKGSFYVAEVTMVSNKTLCYIIKKALTQQPSWPQHIHIAAAPTKMMERIEWFAEKATEIGINEFSFLECHFSERRNLRADRIDKIVVAAMKQSRKAWKPIVNDLQTFKSFVEQPREGLKFICHCYNEIPREDLFSILKNEYNSELTSSSIPDITIMIGPEGDFSIDEVKLAIEHGYKSVSLGSSRLRTETAALSAVMISQLSTK